MKGLNGTTHVKIVFLARSRLRGKRSYPLMISVKPARPLTSLSFHSTLKFIAVNFLAVILLELLRNEPPGT